ncbi:hypothetical protein L0F63_002562 [Massospora cicadina]|nr:hypothetical protein L0F63_002562 [Massospora cicadina]
MQFILQQSPSEISQDGVAYRIVTRSFPTYLVAKSEILPEALDHFRFLHEEFLERMPAKKPKELVINLIVNYKDFPEYIPPKSEDSFTFNDEAITSELNERIEKRCSAMLKIVMKRCLALRLP